MDQLEGLSVGLMVNHDYQNNCEGGGVSPNNRCSNGGYMALGFKKFDNTAAGTANKEAFHTFLANMPTPSGNLSHSYQGKELFFEFFRYLTGQGI